MSRLVTWRSDATTVQGTFFDDDIPTLWPAKHFPVNLRETIVSLLLHFEIMHLLNESDSVATSGFQRVFVVPCMLPEEERPIPPYLEGSFGKTYIRRFSFSFAPFGMFPQLLIRMMALCRANLELWKWGLVGILRAAGSRHLVRVKGSFDPSGKGDVEFQLKTNDETGLLLHIIISPFESLLRSCYPNAKPRRLVIKPGTLEELDADKMMQETTGIVDENSLLGQLAPDLALQSSLQVDMSSLVMGKEIGRGGFGSIRLATLKGREVVVKTLFEENTGAAYQELLRECRMMSFLDHVNVIQLLGVCTTPLSIVMEYANAHDFRSFLNTYHNDLPVFVRLKLLVDIASGMNYAHSQTPPVIHMDLKSPNVLVHKDEAGLVTAKVADLGLATVFAYSLKHEAADNPRWLAPEAIRGQKVSRKVDVYSFAIIMYEAMSGKFPFEVEEKQFPFSFQFADAIANGLRPNVDDVAGVEGLPSMFVPLMKRSWAPDPLSRPSFLECLQLLYAMLQEVGTPSLYESKQVLLSQLGVINSSSLSYVDQVVTWGAAEEEICVLHTDGFLANYQLMDGQSLWSVNLHDEAKRDPDDTTAVATATKSAFVCHAGSSLWVSTGSPNVSVFNGQGMRDVKTLGLKVSEMVAAGNYLVAAGQSLTSGRHVLEVYAVDSGKRLSGSGQEFRMLFGGIMVSIPKRDTSMLYAWFLQQHSQQQGGDGGAIADSLVQVCAQTGEAVVVKPPSSSGKMGYVFLTAVQDVVWSFDSNGSVTVFDAASRSYSDTFSLHQPLQKAVYIASIKRVLAVTRTQSVFLVHPDFKTTIMVIKSISVVFGLASKALSVSQHLGQVIVGGEAVCLFKMHRVKQAVSTGTVRSSKPVSSKSLENDISSIKQLEALSVSHPSTIIVRESTLSNSSSLEEIIHQLTASGTSHAPESPMIVASPAAQSKPLVSSKPSLPQLKRQESVLMDEDGFHSVIRDLEKPMAERPSPVTRVKEDVAPPLPPARTLPATPGARKQPSTSSISSSSAPAGISQIAASGSAATGVANTSASQSTLNSGAMIRNAYGVKEKVTVRASGVGDVFPFCVETEFGQIGWGRKEESEFVFFDLTGAQLLRLEHSVMAKAKKSSQRVSSQSMLSKPPAPVPPQRGTSSGVARPAVPRRPDPRNESMSPRRNLIVNVDVQNVVFRSARRFEKERRMLQFCGWVAVFRNVVDPFVRYELAGKLFFEFLRPNRPGMEISLGPRIRDPLVGVLAPLMDADDVASVGELPLDFFDEAVSAIHALTRESMYGVCLKEMRERLVALSKESRDERTATEIKALQKAVQLTYDEFVIMMKSYRDVTGILQQQQQQQQQQQIPQSPRRQNPPPMASVVSGNREFRSASNSRGVSSGARNSPQVSRHGSLGSEEEAKIASTPTLSLARTSFANRHVNFKKIVTFFV